VRHAEKSEKHSAVNLPAAGRRQLSEPESEPGTSRQTKFHCEVKLVNVTANLQAATDSRSVRKRERPEEYRSSQEHKKEI
jgi:hypothetical protein